MTEILELKQRGVNIELDLLKNLSGAEKLSSYRNLIEDAMLIYRKINHHTEQTINVHYVPLNKYTLFYFIYISNWFS